MQPIFVSPVSPDAGLLLNQEFSRMFRPRVSRLLLSFLGFSLVLLSAHGITVQAETWEPATTGFDTEIKVWTSSGNTYAKVRLTFPTGGWRVDWGQVTRNGNDFTADARVERWNGGSTQAIMYKENTYNLGALPPGTHTFTFKSYGVATKSQQFDPSLIAERWEPATLSGYRVVIRMLTFTGGLVYPKLELYLPDTSYRVLDWGQLVRSGNELSVDIKVEHWTGDSEARETIINHDYGPITLSPGAYLFVVKIYGTTVKTQSFTTSEQSAPAPKLLTEENSERAIALDSVTWLRLFPLVTPHNFSSDQRTRMMLFLSNVEWPPNENLSAMTVQAEDAQHVIYPMTIEYVGKVPGFDWLTQVIVRPAEGLKDGGDVWVNVSVRGAASNKGLVSIKPSGTNSQ
jgi:hypothetical protein